MVDPEMLLSLVPNELAGLSPTARRIVTAARDCFVDYGFGPTTMQLIADTAGVGVATVYRQFGHKRDLVRLTILDEALRLTTLLAEVAEVAATPEDGLIETLAAFVHEASAPKLLTRSIRDSPAAGELSGFLTDDTAIAAARMLVATWLDRWQDRGQLPTSLDTEVIGEILGRLMISLVDNPSSIIPLNDVDKARDFARQYLVPLLQTARSTSH